jgi:hypothetical protein
VAVFDETPEQATVRDLTNDLALAQSYYVLSQSAAWSDLEVELQKLVDVAQQEHFSSRDTDPYKIIEEKCRWQQRLMMLQSARTIVQRNLDVREEILNELKQEGEINE